MKKYFLNLLALSLSQLLACPTMAQGLVTEIKVCAIQEFKDLENLARGYSGGGDKDLDFRKGRGGGYVFTIFKNTPETPRDYITDVAVKTKTAYGVEYDENGKKYTPVPFFQAKKHEDKKYQGGLNGRNYSIYGGDYTGQPHIYVSRTGNQDFNNKVLKDAYVTTSKPKNLRSDQTSSGGHAGGGRYLVFTWHTHEAKFRPKTSDEAPGGDIEKHYRYCNRDQCGLSKEEPHRFAQLYGNDTWMILAKTGTDRDTLIAKSHYKKCKDCGQIVYDAHKWATYSSADGSHSKRCLVCDYVMEADHVNFGKQKLPVDEYYHMIYCADCGYLKKLRHDFSGNQFVVKQDCEHTVLKYTCKQCYHEAYFEETGVGHDFDAYGICRRTGCLHPYEQPAVERLAGGDSVYVVKNFGNLYWIADYVNNRRPKTNIRLDNDLQADELMRLPWHPIGDTDSTAFQGSFDGGNHVITMLQTEEPVAGCGYRGLFGAIGKDATVQNVAIAGCHMRGWNYVGAIAGVNEGTIKNCHVAFSIMSSIGTGMNLGGICGLNRKTGAISGCKTEKDVWVGGVRDYAGGICGTNDGGSLSGNTSQAICGSGSDGELPQTASEQ